MYVYVHVLYAAILCIDTELYKYKHKEPSADP